MVAVITPKGVVPKAQDCELGPDYASIAENIRLRHGRWEPWKTPREVVKLPKGSRSAHVRDCCWTADTECLSSYVDAGACQRTYRSSPNERILVTDSLCEYDWTYLGVPVPDPILTRSNRRASSDTSPDTALVGYLITYSTPCGEGPPSCTEMVGKLDKEDCVEILFPPEPDPMWGVTHVNVYRTASLWDSSQGLVDFNPNALESSWNSSVVQTDYFLVATVPVHAGGYVDVPLSDKDKTLTKFGKMLTTEDSSPPKQGLQIGGETDSGSLVGWIDNEVWFSERNMYHAWPLKARMNFPYNVQRVCVCNDTVFVLTDHHSFILEDSIDCRDSTCRPVSMAKDSYPLCSQRSCVVLPNAVLYSSEEGLVLLGSDTSSRIVSSLAFAKDDWIALGPNEIQIETAHSYLFLLTDREFLVWDLALDEFGLLPDNLTTMDFTPDSLIIDQSDDLFFLLDDVGYKFDAGDSYMRMRWRQALQDTGAQQSMSAARVKYLEKRSPTHNKLTLIQNDRVVVSRDIGHKPIRVRSSLGSCYQWEISGTEPLCGLYYGTGINSLVEGRQ